MIHGFDAKTRKLRAKWLDCPIVRAVFAALNRQGFEARIVGGAVRNTLLGLPVHDIDFATTATPSDIERLAKDSGLKTIPTGLDHGTLTLVPGSGPQEASCGPQSVEVTTLRCDTQTDGRHAKVRFTTDWAKDAARRDFTMNALYVDARHHLFDPVGGLADLKARRVRFIGGPAARIAEDYLRILRFFRFMAHYGAPSSPPDRAALEACTRARAGLLRLSGERIRAEMLKLLTGRDAVHTLATMQAYGILPLVAGVTSLKTLENLIRAEQTLKLSPDPLRRLAALAVRIEEDVTGFAARWRLSNGQRSRLLSMVATKPAIFQDMREPEARRALYRLGADTWRDRVLFTWARSEADYQPGRWVWLFELPGRWTVPVFPVKGADITALGVPQGPGVGRLLRLLEAWWMARDFRPNRRLLLRTAKKMLHGQQVASL